MCTCTNYISGLFTDESFGILTLDSMQSYEEGMIYMDAILSKDTRQTRIESEVFLTAGDPPQIKITLDILIQNISVVLIIIIIIILLFLLFVVVICTQICYTVKVVIITRFYL